MLNWDNKVKLNNVANAAPFQLNKLEEYFFRKQLDWFKTINLNIFFKNYHILGNTKNLSKQLTSKQLFDLFKHQNSAIVQNRIMQKYLYAMPLRAKAKVYKKWQRKANAYSTGLDSWRKKHERYSLSFSMASKAPLMPTAFQRARFSRALRKQRAFLFSEGYKYPRLHWREQIQYEDRPVNEYTIQRENILWFNIVKDLYTDFRRINKYMWKEKYQLKKKFNETDIFMHIKHPYYRVGPRSIWFNKFSNSKHWKERRKRHTYWDPKIKIPRRPLRKFHFLI